jgi:CDP-diacylglycerol--serine O-phosphatidyltransferase
MAGDAGKNSTDHAGKLRPHLPPWLEQLERAAAGAVTLSPNALSAVKIVVIAPLLLAGLRQIDLLPEPPRLTVALYLAFGLLDYLQSIAARYRHLGSPAQRFFARATDFALLACLAVFCLPLLPAGLLAAKVLLQLALITLYILGRGKAENRFYTGINYAALFALLALSQGWAPHFITAELVRSLLWVNILFSAIVVLYNAGVLHKRYIADALSGSNLLCGVFSMYFAARGRVDISMLFLLLGAAFDGFDGAAARAFGGTRWGVYSDDVADALDYGIAPGVAIYFILGGTTGLVIGAFYSLFTLGRLVFFTLNKAGSDPNYFCGVPSTAGSVVALSALVGLVVGIACMQMVSFDTHYRHLGRALSSNRRIIYGMPVLLALLLAGGLIWGIKIPVAIIFAACLVYGFLPTVMHFAQALGSKARHGAERGLHA